MRSSFPTVAAYDSVPNGVLPPNDPKAILSQEVLFRLKCQRFVEIIRSRATMDAIQYAQINLKPKNHKQRELIKEITTLIAYEDPSTSQSSYLLRQERLDSLAEQVHDVILGKILHLLIVYSGS